MVFMFFGLSIEETVGGQMLILVPSSPHPHLPYSGLLRYSRTVVKSTDAGARLPGFKY